MAAQKAEVEKMLRQGGTDPWAVDFNKELEGKDLSDPNDTMLDKASGFESKGNKSFSF